MDTKTRTLEERFVKLLESNEDGGVLAEDVLLDVTVPMWRYQVQGRAAAIATLRHDSPKGQTIERSSVTQTASGFVAEIDSRYVGHDGASVYCRYVNLVQVRDGKVAEWTVYCGGEWDEATEARQKAEAPMIRQ